jgi:hypothetical protein
VESRGSGGCVEAPVAPRQSPWWTSRVYMAGEAVPLSCLISTHTYSIRLCTWSLVIDSQGMSCQCVACCEVSITNVSLFACSNPIDVSFARCFGRRGRSSALPVLLNFRTSLTIVSWSLLNLWWFLINSNCIHTLYGYYYKQQKWEFENNL